LKIIDVIQRSEQWHDLRLGSIGGSAINAVLAQGSGKTRKKLLYQLAAEILTRHKTDNFVSAEMQRGIDYESEARTAYEILTGHKVDVVGMIVPDDAVGIHASPDGLVGDNGVIEIKVLLPHVFVEQVDTGAIKTAYKRQIQHILWVSERSWCDYVAYCPEMPDPLYIQRVERSKSAISTIVEKCGAFRKELNDLVAKMEKR